MVLLLQMAQIVPTVAKYNLCLALEMKKLQKTLLKLPNFQIQLPKKAKNLKISWVSDQKVTKYSFSSKIKSPNSKISTIPKTAADPAKTKKRFPTPKT